MPIGVVWERRVLAEPADLVLRGREATAQLIERGIVRARAVASHEKYDLSARRTQSHELGSDHLRSGRGGTGLDRARARNGERNGAGGRGGAGPPRAPLPPAGGGRPPPPHTQERRGRRSPH